MSARLVFFNIRPTSVYLDCVTLLESLITSALKFVTFLTSASSQLQPFNVNKLSSLAKGLNFFYKVKDVLVTNLSLENLQTLFCYITCYASMMIQYSHDPNSRHPKTEYILILDN